MAADAALHEGLIRADEIPAVVARSSGAPGIRRARAVLTLASALIESPLESLTHLALHEDGFPPPQLQFPVVGADGKRYRADFAWPEFRLVLEADGRLKYQAEELWAEKGREFALARAGWRAVRVRWLDVARNWSTTSAWLRSLMIADRSS
jgi:hypothetical protein